MPEFVQIVTTCDQRDVLQQLAHQLIEDRLAACVQIGGPVDSVYQWQGTTETSQEWICTIKTRASCADGVQSTIARLHPYDEPEILVFTIDGGSPSYLQWIAGQTNGN